MIIMVLLLLHITMMILFSTPQKVPLGMQTCVLNTQRGVIITRRGVIILLQFLITGVIRQCCGVVFLIGFLRWSSLASCFENILLLHYRVPARRITPRFLKHVRNLRGAGGRHAKASLTYTSPLWFCCAVAIHWAPGNVFALGKTFVSLVYE